jgi:hypothetical protein
MEDEPSMKYTCKRISGKQRRKKRMCTEPICNRNRKSRSTECRGKQICIVMYFMRVVRKNIKSGVFIRKQL